MTKEIKVGFCSYTTPTPTDPPPCLRLLALLKCEEQPENISSVHPERISFNIDWTEHTQKISLKRILESLQTKRRARRASPTPVKVNAESQGSAAARPLLEEPDLPEPPRGRISPGSGGGKPKAPFNNLSDAASPPWHGPAAPCVPYPVSPVPQDPVSRIPRPAGPRVPYPPSRRVPCPTAPTPLPSLPLRSYPAEAAHPHARRHVPPAPPQGPGAAQGPAQSVRAARRRLRSVPRSRKPTRLPRAPRGAAGAP